MEGYWKNPRLGFSLNLFEQRRKIVFNALGNAVLVLASGPVKKKSRDIGIPFRPDSDFFYVTGMCEPDFVALLKPNGLDGDLILFVPTRDYDEEVWTGQRMGPEEIKCEYGATEVYGRHQLEQLLPSLLSNTDEVYFRFGSDQQVQDLVLSSLNSSQFHKSRGSKWPRGVLDPGSLLHEMRLVKDEEEVNRIRKAAEITSEAFREMLVYCGPGAGEWELAAALEFGFRKRGASGPAYPTIVGSGNNGCVLHYSENSRIMEADDLVLVDGGAEVGLYAGDMTRTFPVSGSFSKVQKEVYGVVTKAYECAIKKVGPGIAIEDIHKTATDCLIDGLLHLGVLKGSAEEVLDKGIHKPFFPHQTSHWLGLDVHDVGDYLKDGRSRILEPGMILTVEPGLYFSESTEELEEFYGIGIRIEDDLLVTDRGSESLGCSLPIIAEDVENLVKVSK